MADAKIKVKRTDTETNRANSSALLEYGQPLYVKDSNHLYVGDGTTQAKNLKYINQKEVEDINNTIGGVTQGKTVVEMISDTQTAAAQDATTKVNSLANGQVTTNKNDIANIKTTLLPNETSAREQADTELSNKIDTTKSELESKITKETQRAQTAENTLSNDKLDKKTGYTGVYVNDGVDNPVLIGFSSGDDGTTELLKDTFVQRSSAGQGSSGGRVRANAAIADHDCMIKKQFQVTTETDYNRLPSKDANTFYFITNA